MLSPSSLPQSRIWINSRFTILFMLVTLATGCSTTATVEPVTLQQAATAAATNTPVPAVVSTGLPPTPTAPPTSTATATPLVTPTPTSTPEPTPTPTPDRTIACSERLLDDSLLAVVTLTYGLSRDYEPPDLVPLSDYLSSDVTLGYPTELRAIAVGPLVRMIADMHAAGLDPKIISGYRSYSAQAIARQKWAEKEPERVGILSAPPGFSEHQLGTVVDFGSPELPAIVGQEDIEFHTWFYRTSEGIWLLENAHNYGFTLSYPFEATDVTGFFYEPWHFRYVGVETAQLLHEAGLSLTEYQLANEPPPCVPDNQS